MAFRRIFPFHIRPGFPHETQSGFGSFFRREQAPQLFVGNDQPAFKLSIRHLLSARSDKHEELSQTARTADKRVHLLSTETFGLRDPIEKKTAFQGIQRKFMVVAQ